MAKAANKSREELERLLSEYVEEKQKLCRFYNMYLKRDKNQQLRIKAIANELIRLHVETEDESVYEFLQSGIKVIRRTIELISDLESDSDPIQPCSTMVVPRALTYNEREILRPGLFQHAQKMMEIQNLLRKQPSTAQELIFGHLLQVYKKMGFDTKDFVPCAEVKRAIVQSSNNPAGANLSAETAALLKKEMKGIKEKKGVPQDCSWKMTTPSEVKTDAVVKYSVSSSAGMFECSETGLRWRAVAPVALEYWFVEWESFSAKLETLNYKPCGPLMDITVTSGSLEEIHLPHYICIDSVPSAPIKALHVDDIGLSLEKCKLTKFHAKLLNPTFSLLGIVAEIHQYFTLKFYCETLIYRTRTPALNLHVYLIVKDPNQRKAVEKDEKGNKLILKPRPNEAQKINEPYALKTSCVSTVKPKSLTLTPSNPNFFDVYIEEARGNVELQIITKNGEKIWDVDILTDDLEINSSVTDGGRMTSSMSDRDMSDILLEHLKSLKSDKLKEFKWHLTKGVPDFNKLAESDLERAERSDVVTHMIDQYEEDGAAKVTVIILGKIQMNNNAKELQETLDKMNTLKK